MSENNHIDEFDLQMRSILENGQEEVPAGVWDGVSAGLDKAARGKVISLWLKRAGLGVAAAAAAVAGFIYVDSTSRTDLVSPASENMIAVVEETNIATAAPEEDCLATIDLPKEAKLISKIAKQDYPMHSVEPQIAKAEEDATVEPSKQCDEAATHEPSIKKTNQETEQQATSSWIEEREPKKHKIRASLVISGIAGTNSPSASAQKAIFRSPALDRAPSTTIVQQTGSDISYGIPLSFGLGAKINITRRWAVSAGINYTMLTSRFDGRYINVNEEVIVSEQSAKVKNIQHYVGVPISVYYNIINHEFINFYAHVGGTVEKCVLNKYEIYTSPTIHHTQTVENVQFSANAGIGVEFMLGKHVGIYLDPSLRYYFNGNQPKSIRTAQPLMLGFEAGLRLNL